MMFRVTMLIFLAANATTAFVVKPNFLTRSSGSFCRLSSSSLMSEPSTDEQMSEESSISDEAVVTDQLEMSSDESSDASTSEDSAPSRLTETTRHTVYVGNLPFSTSFQEIRDIFSEHAEVRYVNLPRNRETGNVKGFAFVDVASEEDIAKVVDALDGVELEGRPLRVSRSLDKDQIRSTKNDVDGFKKLYVGNVPFASTKEDIEEYFSNHADVTDVFIPVSKYGEPRGFAFITVKEEDADSVIEATNGVEFMGRKIVVNLPLPPGEKPPKREKPGRMKLFVGNLSFYTTGGTLAEVFEEFGDVFDCYIPQDPDTNNSRGFGFVSMQTDDANAAIGALDGCELDGRIISVNEAKPRASKPRESESDIENDQEGADDSDSSF